MDEWNRHCRSGRQCGSAIQGLDRIWVRYLTDWVYSVITVAVAVAKWEGYGKLADWVCDGSGALLATACRTEVSNSDDTVRLNNQHSRGLTVGHAAHAVDFNRRPILSRQNVLALFRIPTASTNRAAELHEYQRSGFDDGEPFAVVQGYGKLFRHPTAVRRGVSGFRVTQRLNRTINIHEQRERALRENDDALPVNRSEPIRHLVRKTRVIVLSAIVEFHVSVDRHDIAAPAEDDSTS